MFEDATFHSSGILPNQAPKWMLLTLAVNLAVVTALIVLPLIYPEALPTHLFQSILYTPPPQPIVVKPSILQQSATQSTQTIANLINVPRLTPATTPTGLVAPQAEVFDLSHINDGISSSTDPSTNVFQPSTPIVVKSAPTHPMNISMGVSEGMILSKTNPTYPVIARTAGISGTIVLAATISATGRIENLKVLNGPPMLRQAAVDAVKTWRYRPYLLNNQPVEVETTINIVFTLGSR